MGKAKAAGKPKKVKQEASEWVPQTREQVTAAIAEIGEHQRERDRIQADMNDELAAVKERHEKQAEPHNEAIVALSRGVRTWCEANRESLTGGGKTKTASLPSGEVKWRMRPPKVVVRAVDSVLQALKQLGFSRFVRTKEEINKEAILLEPAAVAGIKGISVTQGEDFIIMPFETKLEEVAA
ncbi:MAG: host-nuclease inhibitor Gam family protein [Desulfobacteraceae bacterium]|nr:host-nuclease inhibitor Gam family protein [Desulfobacteraceae bacterium]